MGYKISADRYVEVCKKTMKRKTKYKNSPPWNCGYYDGVYLYGDCWCFNPKVILWSESTNDPVYDNYTVGKYYYWDGIKASGMPDTFGDVIMQDYCTQVSFAKMLADKKAPCLLLITGHHMGAYIGEWTENGKTYNTCEFTPNEWLGDGLCPSYCDENGARRTCKDGTIIGYWNKAGYLTSFVDYTNAKSTSTQVEEKHYSTDELADRIISGIYGSGEARKNALKEAGYTTAEITAAQQKVNAIMAAKEQTEEAVKHFADVNVTNSGVNGIDISHHNGEVDFAKVKKAGITFIIPRDGWGENDIDRKFLEYVEEAKNNGISVPGVYHFIYAANKEQVIQNAQKAIENVQKARLPKTTVIWCDLEYDTVDNARDYRGTILTPAMQKEFVETFCDYIMSQGYPTGVYVNQDYMYRVFGGKDFGKKYDLWLADLEGEAAYECVYRQTGTAPVDGCPYQVDTDEYYGQYTAGTAKPKGSNTTTKVDESTKTEEQQEEETSAIKIAMQILDGKWGNNPERKKNITAKYGANMYAQAQHYVDRLMDYKTYCNIAVEIWKGKWGYNPDRKKNITAKYGSTAYDVAQGYVNSGYSESDISNGYKVAIDILNGKYGNNPERKKRVISDYNTHVYEIAQGIINGVLK